MLFPQGRALGQWRDGEAVRRDYDQVQATHVAAITSARPRLPFPRWMVDPHATGRPMPRHVGTYRRMRRGARGSDRRITARLMHGAGAGADLVPQAIGLSAYAVKIIEQRPYALVDPRPVAHAPDDALPLRFSTTHNCRALDHTQQPGWTAH